MVRVRVPQRTERFSTQQSGQLRTPRIDNNASSDALKKLGNLATEIAVKEEHDHIRAVVQRGRVEVTKAYMDRLEDFKKNYRGAKLVENPNAMEEVMQAYEGDTESILSKYGGKEREAISRNISDVNISFTKGVNRHFAREEENYRVESYKASVANDIAQSGIDFHEKAPGTNEYRWKHYGDMAVTEAMNESKRLGESDAMAENRLRDVYGDLAMTQVMAAVGKKAFDMGNLMLRYYRDKIDPTLHAKLQDKLSDEGDLVASQGHADAAINIFKKKGYTAAMKYISGLEGNQEKLTRRDFQNRLASERSAESYGRTKNFITATNLKREMVEMQLQGGDPTQIMDKATQLSKILPQLAPSAQSHVLGIGTGKETSSDDLGTYNYLLDVQLSDPEGFRNMDLEKYASKLTPETLKKFMNKQQALRAGEETPAEKAMKNRAKIAVEQGGYNTKKGWGGEIYRNLLRWSVDFTERNQNPPTEDDWNRAYERQSKVVNRGLFSPGGTYVARLSANDIADLDYEEAKSKFPAMVVTLTDELEAANRKKGKTPSQPSSDEVVKVLRKRLLIMRGL